MVASPGASDSQGAGTGLNRCRPGVPWRQLQNLLGSLSQGKCSDLFLASKSLSAGSPSPLHLTVGLHTEHGLCWGLELLGQVHFGPGGLSRIRILDHLELSRSLKRAWKRMGSWQSPIMELVGLLWQLSEAEFSLRSDSHEFMRSTGVLLIALKYQI